jgi:hypothetical protein
MRGFQHTGVRQKASNRVYTHIHADTHTHTRRHTHAQTHTCTDTHNQPHTTTLQLRVAHNVDVGTVVTVVGANSLNLPTPQQQTLQ